MKITKNIMKEASEFIICVDPKISCSYDTNYSYDWKGRGMSTGIASMHFKVMEATNIIDAMREADAYWDENVYAIKISQKSHADDEHIVYKDILTCRNEWNWHVTDEQHCEVPCEVLYNPEHKYFA